MDTDATDDQRALLDVSSRFMSDTCPLTCVRSGAWKEPSFAAAYRRQAAQLGWFSMLVPEALGGGSVSGDGVSDAALLAYRRGTMLQPGAFVGTNVLAWSIAAAGSEWARSTVLPALLSGDIAGSWAVDGAGPGLDAGVEGYLLDNGGLQLSGSKRTLQDVDESSWMLVTCSTSSGTAQALVAVGSAGVTIRELDTLDLSRRFYEVTFDGVEVDPDAVVGAPGGVDDLLTQQLAIAATLVVAEMVGAMDHDFTMTVQYAKDRIAFGRPIGSFQGIKHQLADTSLALEMSKAIAIAAARAVGRDDYGPSAASMAKAFVSEAGVDLVQTCFQVYGGIGYTWEHDQHLYLRRITTDAELFGNADWHREYLCRLAGI